MPPSTCNQQDTHSRFVVAWKGRARASVKKEKGPPSMIQWRLQKVASELRRGEKEPRGEVLRNPEEFGGVASRTQPAKIQSRSRLSRRSKEVPRPNVASALPQPTSARSFKSRRPSPPPQRSAVAVNKGDGAVPTRCLRPVRLASHFARASKVVPATHDVAKAGASRRRMLRSVGRNSSGKKRERKRVLLLCPNSRLPKIRRTVELQGNLRCNGHSTHPSRHRAAAKIAAGDDAASSRHRRAEIERPLLNAR